MKIQWLAQALEIPKRCFPCQAIVFNDPSVFPEPCTLRCSRDRANSASPPWLSSRFPSDKAPKAKGRQALEAVRAGSLKCLQAALLTRFYHTPTLILDPSALTLPMATVTTTASEKLQPVWIADCRKLAESSLQG